MKNKNILISGAGLAGITLAYWLKKYGFNPTVIEKHHELRTGGYKIDIRGSAMEVVRQMGIADEIKENNTDLKESKFVGSNGQILAEAHPDTTGVRAVGDLEIVRGTLCEILYKHVQDVEYIFSDSISSISEKEDGVFVEFKKGEPREFDLVIGADGLHSKTRDLVFGDESKYLKQMGSLYISFYSIPNYLNLDRVEFEYHTPGRFGIVYCPRDGDAKVGYGFTMRGKGDVDLRDRKAQEKVLYELYKDQGWEFKTLLSHMKDSPDFYFDKIAQIKMDTWSKGRVSLVGDCGYCPSPISGQGTSLAMVGAYILAGELYANEGDYKKAFKSYEKQMRHFVEKNQKLADTSLALFEGKIVSWLFTKMMWLVRLFGTSIFGKWLKLIQGHFGKKMEKTSNDIHLKRYS